MTLTVNGERHDLPTDSTVADLLGTLDLPDSGVAVAVDGDVIPHSGWSTVKLRDGAHIDILTAVQGG